MLNPLFAVAVHTVFYTLYGLCIFVGLHGCLPLCTIAPGRCHLLSGFSIADSILCICGSGFVHCANLYPGLHGSWLPFCTIAPGE